MRGGPEAVSFVARHRRTVHGRARVSLDAIVYKGTVTVCGVADRHVFFPPNFVELGHTMPTSLDEKAVGRIVAVFEAGIKAIGIDFGAAKGDLKLTRTGPMVGEIAARLSGGYMSGWTFPLSSGVEVTEAALNISVGFQRGTSHPVCIVPARSGPSSPYPA